GWAGVREGHALFNHWRRVRFRVGAAAVNIPGVGFGIARSRLAEYGCSAHRDRRRRAYVGVVRYPRGGEPAHAKDQGARRQHARRDGPVVQGHGTPDQPDDEQPGGRDNAGDAGGDHLSTDSPAPADQLPASAGAAPRPPAPLAASGAPPLTSPLGAL